MKLKSQNRFLTHTALIAMAGALSLCFCNRLQAQPNPDSPQRPKPQPGENRRMERPQQGQGFQPGFQGGPGFPIIDRVLTEDQRESMRDLLKADREKMRGIAEKIREARKTLMKASVVDEFNEDSIRAKALEVAKLEAELSVIRAKAFSQLQPPLSQEQIDQIMNPPQMQPGQGFQPGGDNQQRPGQRRMNRPQGGPREGGDLPPPPKRDPQ